MRRLTNDVTSDSNPSWAPGGKRLVFSRLVAQTFQLFVVRFAIGTHMNQITTMPADAVQPAWSPDGQRILFYSLALRHHRHLLRRAGRNRSHGPNLREDTTNYTGPEWSPDGGTIVFGGNHVLMAMSPDGNDLRFARNRGPQPIVVAEWQVSDRGIGSIAQATIAVSESGPTAPASTGYPPKTWSAIHLTGNPTENRTHRRSIKKGARSFDRASCKFSCRTPYIMPPMPPMPPMPGMPPPARLRPRACRR